MLQNNWVVICDVKADDVNKVEMSVHNTKPYADTEKVIQALALFSFSSYGIFIENK